jgi:hypothetical protein
MPPFQVNPGHNVPDYTFHDRDVNRPPAFSSFRRQESIYNDITIAFTAEVLHGGEVRSFPEDF